MSIIMYNELVNFTNYIDKNLYKHEDLDDLVSEYLEKNNKKWGLNLFIKLYQDFLENKILEDMCENYHYEFDKHTYEIKSEDYIDKFKLFCRSEESLECIKNISLYKNPVLKPIFKEFILFLKKENIYTSIDLELKTLAKHAFKENEDIRKWFNRVIETNSNILISYFEIYLKNPLNSCYIDDFELYITENDEWNTDILKVPEYIYNEIIDIESLSKTNRHRQLMETAEIYIVDKKLNPKIKGDKPTGHEKVLNISVYNNEILLDFIVYLEKSKLKLEKHIPDILLNKYIVDYIEKVDFDTKINKRILKKSVKQLLLNKKQLRYYIQKYVYKDIPNMFSIDRYYECQNKGIMLFKSRDEFSKFINKRTITDLHYLTGNNFDIYFTNKDLKKDISAYKRIDKWVSLNVEKKDIPCLLLWEKDKVELKVLHLHELDNNEIFNVIEVLSIELENKTLNESIVKAKEKIDAIKRKKENNMNGGIVMNNNFNNCNNIVINGNGARVETINLSSSIVTKDLDLEELHKDIIDIKKELEKKDKKVTDDYKALALLSEFEESSSKNDLNSIKNKIKTDVSEKIYEILKTLGNGILSNLMSNILC